MKTSIFSISLLVIATLFSCKENGNDGVDNTRGGKTFENAVSNDSAGREQTIDGEETRTDTTNIKRGEKNH